VTLPYSDDVLRLNPELRNLTRLQVDGASPSKYKNARTEAHGMVFQSGKEAAGVSNLILAEKSRQIYALRLQVAFPLPGRTSYVADAVYLDDKLEPHIVDFKGFVTKEFKIKARLFRERYGKEIELR